MPAFDAVRVISFDCYGTLIDWETGILAALRPLLQHHVGEQPLTDAEILERYARFEAAAEAGPYRTYREVLRGVVDGFASELGFEVSADERRGLESSLARWQPFPDTNAALTALARRYRLAVFSNIDDDLFEATASQLSVDFAHVVTARQVGAYKPAPEFFAAALEAIEESPAALLHVAQSLYHDIAPAKRLGLTTVWVNRRQGRAGFGATPPGAATPDLEVPDLQALVLALALE